MARIFEKDNPFDANEISREHSIAGGLSILEWLKSRFGESFETFSKPTICIKNGKPILRKYWADTFIGPTDVIVFNRVSGDPFTIIAIVVAASAAYTALSIDIPKVERPDKADDVFSLNAEQNQFKVGQPIELVMGKPIHYPSYAAEPYNRFINNEQYRYQLFCVCVGGYEPDGTFIENTPIDNFNEVDYAYYQPGEKPTLFPTSIVRSSEVGNLLLIKNGEPGWGPQGPFVINDPGTQIDKIEVDFALHQGLYGSPEGGGINNAQCNVTFEYQEIDDNGDPVGGWTTLESWERIMKTTKAQRVTLSKSVPAGRYQVRGYDYSFALASDNYGKNEAHWTGLKGFYVDENDYGNVTLLAVVSKASNNLNDSASNRINVNGTSKVPVWDGLSWSAPQASRNAIWHFLDLWRNIDKGPGLDDSYFNLTNYKALADAADARGDKLDYTINTISTTWDVGENILRTIRCRPEASGSSIQVVRDEPKTLASGVFNQHNIKPGSFERHIKLSNIGDHDGFEMEYMDGATGNKQTVNCLVGTDAGTNLKNVKFPGVTQRDQVFQEGMYLRASEKYQNETIQFTTGMEGRFLSLFDLILVSYDVLDTRQAGQVLSITGSTIELSEPVEFDLPDIHAIYLRKKNGESVGPFNVTPGAHSKQVISESVIDTSDMFFEDDHNFENTLFQFGKLNEITTECVLLSAKPSGEEETQIEAVVADPRVHSFGSVPTPSIESQTKVVVDPLPTIDNLTVNTEANPRNALVSWDASQHARYYTVEVSYDDENWDFVTTTTENTVLVPTPFAATYYIRVAAINVGRGDWAEWSGTVGSVEPPRNISLASGTDYLAKHANGSVIISQLHVEFDPSTTPSAGGYEVQYVHNDDYASGNWLNAGLVGSPSKGINIPNVSDGEDYYVRVRSVVGELLKSSWVEAGPHTIIGKTAPPATPSGLAAVAQVNGVRLTVTESSELDFSHYLVYTNTSNSIPADYDYVMSDNIKTVTGLVAGQVYYFWLKAVDTSGNVSGSTTAVNATPLALDTGPQGDPGAPAINFIAPTEIVPTDYDYLDYDPTIHKVDTVLLVGGVPKTYAAAAQNDRWRYANLVYTNGTAASIGSSGEVGFATVSNYPVQTITGDIVYRDSAGIDFPIPYTTSFKQVPAGEEPVKIDVFTKTVHTDPDYVGYDPTAYPLEPFVSQKGVIVPYNASGGNFTWRYKSGSVSSSGGTLDGAHALPQYRFSSVIPAEQTVSGIIEYTNRIGEVIEYNFELKWIQVADGDAANVFVRYADSLDGTVNFNATGGHYTGFQITFDDVASTDPADYTWNLTKGQAGSGAITWEYIEPHASWSWSANPSDIEFLSSNSYRKVAANTTNNGHIGTVESFSKGCFVSFKPIEGGISDYYASVWLTQFQGILPEYIPTPYEAEDAKAVLAIGKSGGNRYIQLVVSLDPLDPTNKVHSDVVWEEWSVNDTFRLEYSDGYARVYRNGVLKLSLSTIPDLTFYVAAVVSGQYDGMQNLQYGSIGLQGDTGSPSVNGILTNETHAIPVDNLGGNGNYAGASTDIIIFEGSTDDTSNWTLSKVDSNVTSSLVGNTVTVSNISADTGTVTITASKSGYADIVKVFSLTKSWAPVDGDPGDSAESVRLSASSQIFKVTEAGANSPASIELTATGQNVSGSPVFNIVDGTATLTGSGNSRTLTYANMGADLVRVRVTWDSQIDEITLLKLYDGAKGDKGDDGEDAKVLRLASTSQVFRVITEQHRVPQLITITAYSQNLTGSPTFTVVEGTATLSGTGSQRTLSYADMDTDLIRVEVSWDGLTEQLTLTKLYDGAAPITWEYKAPNASYGYANDPDVIEPLSANSFVKAENSTDFNATFGSVESFTGGCFASFKPIIASGSPKYVAFWLHQKPDEYPTNTPSPFNEDDTKILFGATYSGGVGLIFLVAAKDPFTQPPNHNNNVSINEDWSEADTFRIEYSDGYARAYKNGVLKLQLKTLKDKTFYALGFVRYQNDGMKNMQFGYLASRGNDASQHNYADPDQLTIPVQGVMGDWQLYNSPNERNDIRKDLQGPYGLYPKINRVLPHLTTGAWRGGLRFNHNYIDQDKNYVSYFWVRRRTSNTELLYAGWTETSACVELSNDGGSSWSNTTNPYYISAVKNQMVAGKWYLAVGVIHAKNSTQVEDIDGLYDPDNLEAPVYASSVRFRFQDGASAFYWRMGQYEADDSQVDGDGFDFAPYGLFEMNSAHPRIEDVANIGRIVTVYKSASSAPEAPTGDGIPTGQQWSQDPIQSNANEVVFASSARLFAGGKLNGDWSPPIRIEGATTFYGDKDSYSSIAIDGDVVFDTTENNRIYRRDGTNWVDRQAKLRMLDLPNLGIGNMIPDPWFENSSEWRNSGSGSSISGVRDDGVNAYKGNGYAEIGTGGSAYIDTAYSYPCTGGEQVYVKSFVKRDAGWVGDARIILYQYDSAGSYITGSVIDKTASTSWSVMEGIATIHTNARSFKVGVSRQSEAGSGSLYFGYLEARKAITAGLVGANEIITSTANIASAVVLDAFISNLSAGKITSGTITAQELVISGGASGIIRSSNFSAVEGSEAGWYLDGTGKFVANDIELRGSIVVTGSSVIGADLVISAGGTIVSSDFGYGFAGFLIDPDDQVQINTDFEVNDAVSGSSLYFGQGQFNLTAVDYSLTNTYIEFGTTTDGGSKFTKEEIKIYGAGTTAQALVSPNSISCISGLGDVVELSSSGINFWDGGSLQATIDKALDSIDIVFPDVGGPYDTIELNRGEVNTRNAVVRNQLYFGTAGDTNLYRSAANTLKTDDTFVASRLNLLGGNALVHQTTTDLSTTGSAWYSLRDSGGERGWMGFGLSNASFGIYNQVGPVILNAASGGVKINSGTLLFGSAGDTNLFRDSANVLKTDDAFHCQSLVVGGVAYAPYSGDVLTAQPEPADVTTSSISGAGVIGNAASISSVETALAQLKSYINASIKDTLVDAGVLT